MENEVTNPDQAATKLPAITRVNDIGFRVILIPLFGIAIPLATRMVDHEQFTLWKIKLSYLYTIGIAFLIWEGNRYLLFTLRSYFNWFRSPIQKILILICSAGFYTTLISVLFLIGWFRLFQQGHINWDIIMQATLIVNICVLFITNVYETVFLVKESASEMVRSEQLERAKAETELGALKSQIDPHFIFNSLNTLSHLIEDNPEKARQFNDNLADVYRYILQHKSRNLVILSEEIHFVNDYFSLLTIRFGNAVQLQLEIDAALCDQYLVPPISLQVLIENAIKHNEFSILQPLLITIVLQQDVLLITNPVRKKNLRKPSSRIGLSNLAERYRLTTNQQITIREEADCFMVSLPVLKIN